MLQLRFTCFILYVDWVKSCSNCIDKKLVRCGCCSILAFFVTTCPILNRFGKQPDVEDELLPLDLPPCWCTAQICLYLGAKKNKLWTLGINGTKRPPQWGAIKKILEVYRRSCCHHLVLSFWNSLKATVVDWSAKRKIEVNLVGESLLQRWQSTKGGAMKSWAK